MNLDEELEQLRQDWQAGNQNQIAPDLREFIDKQTRWMHWMVAADVLVTALVGGGFTAWAALAPGPGMTTLALATWLFIAVAWIFRVFANRGQWKPAALDTTTFLDLAVRRCRSRIWAAYFGSALFAGEVGFCLTWIYRYDTDQTVPVRVWLAFSSVPVDLVWIFTLVFTLGVLWYWRKKRAELNYFLHLTAPDPGGNKRLRRPKAASWIS